MKPTSLAVVAALLVVLLCLSPKTHALEEGTQEASTAATEGASEPEICTSWASAIDSVTWTESQVVAPDPNRLMPGGPTSSRTSIGPVRVVGRLIIDRRDMGTLAKPRYRELLRFEPAKADAARPSRVELVVEEAEQAKLLDLVRRGDLPAIMTGRLREAQVRSHDGLNVTTRTELVVEQSKTLDARKAAEVVAELLDASDQQQFVARITPVELASLNVFVEEPVVHPELPNRYRSKVLVRYRTFNRAEHDVELPAAVVRLQLNGQWVDCKPSSAGPATIPAGGYALDSFRMYTPATAASADQEVEVEMTFSLAGEQKRFSKTVRALK